MSVRPWFPLLVSLLLGSAACDLGTKSACDADADCLSGRSCIEGACYKCAADRAGCGCVDNDCLGGMVCDSTNTCVHCSEANPCDGGLTCADERCVPCSAEYPGCACDGGECGPGLACNEAGSCEAVACSDGVLNGDEVDVDCGGSCALCAEGASCVSASDCESFSCDQGTCLPIGECKVRTADFPSIQSAVENPRCTTIVLEEGLFDENVRIDRPLTIVGVPNDEATRGGTVLTNRVPASTIEVAEEGGTVFLRHLQFRDGSALRGAAVHAKQDVVIEHCSFEGNHAGQNATSEVEGPHSCGGAIFVQDAGITIRDSIFVDNVVEETRFTGPGIDVEAAGGAVCVLGRGLILVESSEFRGNRAVTATDIPEESGLLSMGPSRSAASGGAIHRSNGGLTIVRDSTFVNNAARSSVVGEPATRSTIAVGGAIAAPVFFASQPILTTIERSQFVENEALLDGKGGGSAEALVRGGAVVAEGAMIRDTTFEYNRAVSGHPFLGSEGGGLAMAKGRLESSRFLRNSADGPGGRGGGLDLIGPITIVNTVFWNNQGDFSSGLSILGGLQDRVRLINSTLVDNGPGPQFRGLNRAIVLEHSVVAGGQGSCDFGWVLSEGYNVFEEDDCLAQLATETDLVVPKALVEDVRNRSDAPRSSATDAVDGIFSTPGFPLVDSPTIDGGDPNGCRDEEGNEISVDNLGATRSGPCDIGAFASTLEQPTRPPLPAFLLRRVTPRAPGFFAPGEEACAISVAEELATFMNESITGDNDRPPEQECDGLIDAPLVLILDNAQDGNRVAQLLKPTPCIANHLACEDHFSHLVIGTRFHPVVQVLTEEPCALSEERAVVGPGNHGCLEIYLGTVDFNVGVRFSITGTELIGELEVAPDRIVSGVLRGFMDYYAGVASIPSSLQPALGGATRLFDVLCDADLEERDGRQGWYMEFDVEFEAVTLYGEGLPPIRPVDCE